MPRSGDPTEGELAALRRRLFMAGTNPEEIIYVDATIDSIYEYRSGVGTVEITPVGDEFLVRYANGQLNREPLISDARILRAEVAQANPRVPPLRAILDRLEKELNESVGENSSGPREAKIRELISELKALPVSQRSNEAQPWRRH